MQRTITAALTLSILLPLAAGCGAVDKAKMWTLTKFGREYREQLVSRVESARESQGEAQETFQSAYEQLTALTGADGGTLEEKYNALNRAYERADDKAEEVRDRITKVERAANTLFSEWESDNANITSESMRAGADAQLNATRQKYDRMLLAMRDAESRMDPVLEQFNNYVLVLKSSLNAQAIAGLEGEVEAINDDVAALIAEMQQSIEEADKFLRESQLAG